MLSWLLLTCFPLMLTTLLVSLCSKKKSKTAEVTPYRLPPELEAQVGLLVRKDISAEGQKSQTSIESGPVGTIQPPTKTASAETLTDMNRLAEEDRRQAEAKKRAETPVAEVLPSKEPEETVKPPPPCQSEYADPNSAKTISLKDQDFIPTKSETDDKSKK